jgi:hypothetical protein
MQIEKNIPVPEKYPFAQMKEGDSFLISSLMKRTTVTVAAKRYGHKHAMEFTIRKTPDGLRCWRVK